MENIAKNYNHIKGWAIDVDPKNDPTYPMKHRTDVEQLGYTWNRPTQQPISVEVLHSIERPNVTAVFGTSTPPRGLSGMIRRFAFRYGEGSFAHWIPLIVADRVDVVEGILEDLAHGRVPNYVAEKGWPAKWKHDPKGLIQDIAIGVAVASAAVLLLSRKKK